MGWGGTPNTQGWHRWGVQQRVARSLGFVFGGGQERVPPWLSVLRGRRRTSPSGAGRSFWAEAVKEYDLQAHELRLLTEVCRTLDELAALRAAVLADGVVIVGSMGQRRQHPALTELRGLRAELRHLMVQMNFEAPDDGQARLSPDHRACPARGERPLERASESAAWLDAAGLPRQPTRR